MLNIIHGQEERLPGPGGGDEEGHGPQGSHLQRLQDRRQKQAREHKPDKDCEYLITIEL